MLILIVNGEKDPGDENDGSPFWHTHKGWKEDIAALGGFTQHLLQNLESLLGLKRMEC